MFRTIKKYWRLVFGLSFIAAGASSIGTVPVSPYITIAIGVGLTIWHFIFMHQENQKKKDLRNT